MENEKLLIMKFIKNNDLPSLKNYVIENNISIKKYKYTNKSSNLLDKVDNDEFDILVYSIENNASMEIIDYIIFHGQYKNFNYPIYDVYFYDMKNSPLFSALAKNNFTIALKLINKKAELSNAWNTILKPLLEFNSLNKKNLKFILNVDFEGKLFNNFITDIILSSIEYKEEQLVEFIREMFNFYIFNNVFILKLLNFYKNHYSLSKQKLENIIIKEKNKIIIKDQCYKDASYYGLNSILDLLYEYDITGKDIKLNRIDSFRNTRTFTEDILEDEKYFEEELKEFELNFGI